MTHLFSSKERISWRGQNRYFSMSKFYRFFGDTFASHMKNGAVTVYPHTHSTVYEYSLVGSTVQ